MSFPCFFPFMYCHPDLVSVCTKAATFLLLLYRMVRSRGGAASRTAPVDYFEPFGAPWLVAAPRCAREAKLPAGT
jgi:hypothetical protein